MSKLGSFLIVLSMVAETALADTKTMQMSFDSCIARREQVIASLNVNPKDIIPIVNTNIMTTTRVCTSDGSVVVTCSKPDSKMIITTTNKSCR